MLTSPSEGSTTQAGLPSTRMIRVFSTRCRGSPSASAACSPKAAYAALRTFCCASSRTKLSRPISPIERAPVNVIATRISLAAERDLRIGAAVNVVEQERRQTPPGRFPIVRCGRDDHGAGFLLVRGYEFQFRLFALSRSFKWSTK